MITWVEEIPLSWRAVAISHALWSWFVPMLGWEYLQVRLRWSDKIMKSWHLDATVKFNIDCKLSTSYLQVLVRYNLYPDYPKNTFNQGIWWKYGYRSGDTMAYLLYTVYQNCQSSSLVNNDLLSRFIIKYRGALSYHVMDYLYILLYRRSVVYKWFKNGSRPC